MSRVGHTQGVGKWVARSNDVATACKQNARGIGKARSGKYRAYAHKRAPQVGAWCAQARKHTRTQRSLLTLGLGYVCGGAGCVWNMRAQCPEQRTRRGDCVWITRGVVFQHRLAAYSPSTVQVFGAGHTGRLCSSSQQASLPIAVCVLVVGGDVVGVHELQ